jgi:non-ribosomal peptide synthetase component E (peptide arylation enzyme)
VPAGQEGRLQVKGPTLFVGYAERLQMTRAGFEGDWFDTGDLAELDGDGYVNITGRTKDVIIRGGENIPVSYIENVLHEHSKIAAAAVVATPDPRLQERACACVVLRPDAESLSFEELQQFLAAKGVAKQYWPERLELLAELPKTPSGKVRKVELRAMMQDPR